MKKDKEIKIIEKGLYEFLLEFGSFKGSRAIISDNYSYVINPIPKFCNVFDINAGKILSQDDIDNLVMIYEKEKTSFYIITGNFPGYDNDSQKAFLESRKIELRATVFGKILDLKSNKFNLEKNSRIHIREVLYEKDLDNWIAVVKDIFNFPGNHSNLLKEYLMIKLFKEKKFRLFSGIENERVITTGSIYKSGDSAVIYWISTVEDKRKLGFGTAMMNYIVNESQNMGYRYITLQSSAMAYNLYKKMSFRHSFDFNFYSL